MTAEQQAAFDRDGYLIIRGALGPDEAAAAREAIDRVYTAMAKAGSRLSVKLAYWLSDVPAPGRGNLKVVPGSHLTNWIGGPPRRDIRWPDPDCAVEVTAGPGDAVFFDRRIWHTRSRNHSEHTRKAVFFGYTYRWTAIRDDIAPIRASDWPGRLTPGYDGFIWPHHDGFSRPRLGLTRRQGDGLKWPRPPAGSGVSERSAVGGRGSRAGSPTALSGGAATRRRVRPRDRRRFPECRR